MQLARSAIQNSQFTLTVVILMVLVGVVSYFTMPRSEDPQFDIAVTLVDIIYPGASPHDIETQVVQPLEQEFSGIEGIKKVESQIENDGVRIDIKFVYGYEPQKAYDEIKLAVSTVKPNLPAGVEQILVLKATPTSVAVIQMALWTEPTNFKDMEFHAKRLEKRLETIAAVKKADVWGIPQQIVAIDLNLDLIQHYHLNINTINELLKRRAVNITPGFIDVGSRRFNVKASGSYENLNQLSQTVVFANESLVLKLEDIATISFSSAKPTYLSFYKDHPVVFLTVEQRKNTNIFDLTNDLKNELTLFKSQLPNSVKLDVIFEQAESVSTRVNGFFDNLWQGLVLVGVMSLLFLGISEALVVISVIPLSFLIAIGWLDFSGFGLQQMSIVGLIIALGLLVDNAIVVTESIHREKHNRVSIKEAAYKGTNRVSWAITSGTVTTMFAFLPMLMIASDTGDFIRSMPVTVVFVLLASLLLALVFTPLLASKMFAGKPSKYRTLQDVMNKFSAGQYITFLQMIMRQKLLVIVVAISSLVLMFSLFSQVGLSLFPKAEKPMILIDVQAPDNSSLIYTQNVMEELQNSLHKYPLVKSVALNVGNSNPRIYYNEIPKRGVANFGQLLVILKEYNEEDVNQFVAKIRNDFAAWTQADITVKEFTQGPVTDQPITIRLMSESLTQLETVANDLAKEMAKINGVINIDNPIGQANSELFFDIDYEKAGMVGVDISQLEQTLQTVLTGSNVGYFSDQNGENYPILVRAKNPEIETFNSLFITNKVGNKIPLSQVATIKMVKGHSEFSHYQKQRMAKISASASTGYSVTELTAQIVQYLDNYSLPKGMYYTLGGEEESRQESFAGLSHIMIITAVGIFAVLVLQFKSFMQPLVIFTSIPFAIAGSVIGLYWFDLSFSMMAFIGLISLFGIVVNNAIILIDTANYNLKHSSNIRDAILKASATRFTPILLTTLTTIAGLLPLTLYGGGLWQPLGVVIISGLCVSALASFIIVPVLIELFTSNKLIEKR